MKTIVKVYLKDEHGNKDWFVTPINLPDYICIILNFKNKRHMKKKLLSLVTVFSFVSCLVSCSNEKVVNNNNYSEQEKAKIEALMKLFDSYGWELDTTVSIEQRDKELLEMDYERAKTFLEYMSNGIEFDNFEPTTPSGKIRQKP